MMTRSGKKRRFLAVTLIIGLSAVSKTDAHGGHGGHSGGHGGGHAAAPAPHFSGAQRNYKMPRMSHATPSARANTGARRTNNAVARGGNNRAQTRAMHTQGLASNNRSNLGTAPVTGTASTPTNALAATAGTMSNGRFPNTYTYGTGNGARNYRAYGYGNGYRNRGYGRGYGYGRSQGNNRAVVSRLRSVHSSLARIDHDYQGHRVRAMRAVSMAIRQLSNRSMGYSGSGVSSGMNNGRAIGMRQRGGGGGGNNGGARRRQPMSQAQSDARMSQDLRTLQGINMQLGSQGSSTASHGRASGHIQHAIHELNVALSIR